MGFHPRALSGSGRLVRGGPGGDAKPEEKPKPPADAPTGAASVAALTVYDMCKAASKSIVISDIRLLEKSGGKGGTYKA